MPEPGRREVRAMVREVKLRELGYKDYAAYLNSAAWKDVRRRYKASGLPQICRCGSRDWQLHHATYERVGREELEDLIPLCGKCHALVHVLEAAGVIGLDLDGFYYSFERARLNFRMEEARKTQAWEDFIWREKTNRERRQERQQRLFPTRGQPKSARQTNLERRQARVERRAAARAAAFEEAHQAAVSGPRTFEPW